MKIETDEEAAEWLNKKFNGKGVEVKVIDWGKNEMYNYTPTKLLEEYSKWQSERMDKYKGWILPPDTWTTIQKVTGSIPVLTTIKNMNMEHYYVVNGNEYGVDLDTKKNFTNIQDATKHFEEVKYDDFGCKLVYVNSSGIEKDVEIFIND